MKKITIGFLLLFAFTAAVKAQDYKKVRSSLLVYQLNKKEPARLEAAKTELDKLLADPKAEGKAETYLLKSEVLGSISGEPSLKSKYPDADVEALQALQKYTELEPSGEKIKADNYAGLNEMSHSFSTDAAKYFDSKVWDSAYLKFEHVADLSDVLIKNKWSNSSFDTTTYLYTGISAQNAKKDKEAAKYYGAIADHKIVNKDYESIYDYLVKYYLNNKDDANFQKYLALAKEAYPANTTWNDLEFANQSDNASIEDMSKNFAAGEASGKFTSSNYSDYADYFLNNKKVRDLDVEKRKEYIDKATYAYTKAYELDTTKPLLAYNAGVAAYNRFEDASDEARKIKGVTPAIKAQQAQANKGVDSAADKSLLWLEKSYNSLAAKTTRTNTEKTVVGKSADLLYNLYIYKRDRSKILNPKDYDKYDAKSKYYDSMHGKF